ncbi:hypothetical protein ACQEU8_00550 [Streptomyces sp. CA-250714]|uniref:hypothetical protein n=1 Tax=Streptomyces sp. CA-250714 TaxID=3240060 RepID=UPI003D89CB08
MRGALNALSPRQVQVGEFTGLSLDPLDRLHSTTCATAIDVHVPVWEETVTYLADLVPQQAMFARP